MRHPSLLVACVFAVIAATTMTGCSFSSSSLSVLETDRAAEDELPLLEAHAYESVDTATSRFVGEHEGVLLWVAQGTESPACLVAVLNDGDAGPDWILSCGGLPIRMSGVGHTFELRPDGAPTTEDLTRVSENVFAD
ncbi:hypothetical protein [Microbacterium sp. NPDC087589]|uniref:hypothetical protein n=1 Tax=Microbacterium sp. NPDC087589 TaxID=3364191 RepID=UPI0038299FD7